MKYGRFLTVAVALLASLTAVAKGPAAINIMPYPQSVEVTKGSFKAYGALVNCDPNLGSQAQTAVARFATQLTLVSGKTNSFAITPGIKSAISSGKVKGFSFYKDSQLASGEYTIEITDKAALIGASDRYGVLYAIQTIKQMLPVQIYGKVTVPGLDWHMQCVRISDKPRFGYRGVHLDCARHFFDVNEVKKYLDVMAMYKMNRFHWHLTDDQGWRVEIKKYPLLTEVGAYREGTMIGKDFSSDDGIRYGGYYTQAQIKEVIEYADALGITIIPEIDLPGHMVAALAAYPELGCKGGHYEVWKKWGISDDVLCAGKEETFEFLEGVLGEIAEMFPSEYIHIGGDECPKTEWKKCELCQAKIKELGIKATESASAEDFLQNYVMTRVQKFLATKGKKIIGWDEILEGEVAPGATIMSWRGTKGGIAAANAGFDVIMTPNTYCYIDYYQEEDKDNAPLAIGGYLPVEKVYSYNPTDGMETSVHKHILGVQCNLWTEYIATNEYLEYMLLPRILALSEVQWCENKIKDYDRFKSDVINHQFKILDLLGYNYCKEIMK